MSLFCFLGVNMGWDANSLSARMLHLLQQFVPELYFCIDLYSVTLFLPTSSNTAYSLSGIGRFDKILPCPHEDEQEQRLSSASIKFLGLRQIPDSSGISPALDNALSTLLSCSCNTFFLSVFSLPLYIFRWSRSVTTTVNKSQRRQAFACRLF